MPNKQLDSEPRWRGYTQENWRPNVGGAISSGSEPGDWSVKTSTELADGWQFVGWWALLDGVVQLDPSRPIQVIPPKSKQVDMMTLKRTLQRLPVGQIVKEWEYVFKAEYLFELPQEWVDGFTASPRPGRAGHHDRFYAEWVDRYLTAVETQERPMDALIATYAGESKALINGYIRTAERRGLIANRPGRGRAGGTMTEKCRRILDKRNGDVGQEEMG